MNKMNKMIKTIGLLTTVLTVPVMTQAEEVDVNTEIEATNIDENIERGVGYGVVLKDFSIEGNPLTQGDKVRVISVSDNQYEVTIDTIAETLTVDKNHVLFNEKYERSHLEVIEDGTPILLENSPFSEIFKIANKGDTLKILENDRPSDKGGLVKVETDEGFSGWVLNELLEYQYETVENSTTAYISTDNARGGLSYRDEVELVGFNGSEFELITSNGTRLETNRSNVSFTRPAVRVVRQTTTTTTTTTTSNSRTPTTNNRAPAPSTNSNRIERVIENAHQFIGVPYVWGGTTPNGFDCSGYVQYLMRQQGISYPRVSFSQANVGEYVSRGNLRRGDIVFFETYTSGPSHLGIYLGGGEFIHAGGRQVHVSSLNSGYYSSRFLFGRRVL